MNRKKAKRISFCLSDEEDMMLRKEIEQSGLSIQKYIYRAVIQAPKIKAQGDIPPNLSLKDIRLRTGLNAADFAKAFCLDLQTLTDWENLMPAPKPYIVNMIYELCKYRGYFITEQKTDEKKFNIIKTTQVIDKLLSRMAQLTNGDFVDAFNADDFPRCNEMIELQSKLRRLDSSEAEKLISFISVLDL